MLKSEQINELAAALAAVQGSLPAVAKTQTAKIRGESRNGKAYEYSYSYASLDAVWDSCRALLSKNGLSVAQVLDGFEGPPLLVTTLMHTSGQWISSVFQLAATTDPQALGSQITYYRRYALSAMVGIVTDEDDDGQQAQRAAPSVPAAPKPATQAPAAQMAPRSQPEPPAPPSPGSSPPDTPEALEAFLKETKPLFEALPKEQQERLLKKYGGALALDQILPMLRRNIYSEVFDLTAAAAG